MRRLVAARRTMLLRCLVVAVAVLARCPHLRATEAARGERPVSLTFSYQSGTEKTEPVYAALFKENEKGRLTWDVPIDVERRSVLVAGVLWAEIEWDLAPDEQQAIDAFLENIRLTPGREVLLHAEGVWGEFVPGTCWPHLKRRLRVTSIRPTELDTTPARIRYQQLSAEAIHALTDRQLLKVYVPMGTRLFGTPYEPGGPPPCAPVFDGYTKARLGEYEEVRREIVRRGDAIVPRLMRMLRAEVPRRREIHRSPRDAEFLGPLDVSDFQLRPHPSFSTDLIRLLAAIGHPKPARLFLEIAEGYDGQARGQDKSAALGGLQMLTYVSLSPIGPYDGNGQYMLVHPRAAEIPYPEKYDAEKYFQLQLAFFRQWLDGEGKNPGQWLTLARQRARKLLAADDPGSVVMAASFLRPVAHDYLRGGFYETGHDDQPEQTMARVAEMLSRLRVSGTHLFWRRRPNSPVPGDRGHWVSLLTVHGTKARPHAQLIIDKRLSDYQLELVGGEAILDYVFARLAAAGDSKLAYRQIIDRWAGRTFETDEERRDWWEANRELTDEQRMRANLPTLAAQSDARNAEANRIVERILPDAPPYYAEDARGNLGPGPSRAEWLKQHAEQLRYDEQRGVFRLGAAE